MAKETEKRLLRTLEILKEPQGITIPTLVKAMDHEGPQVSLKRIIQTLRGCLESGILKVANGKVKLKQTGTQLDLNKEKPKDGGLETFVGPKSGCGKPNCPSNQKPKPFPKTCPKPLSKQAFIKQTHKSGTAKNKEDPECNGEEKKALDSGFSARGKIKPKYKPKAKQRASKFRTKSTPRGKGRALKSKQKSRQRCLRKVKARRATAKKSLSRKRKA